MPPQPPPALDARQRGHPRPRHPTPRAPASAAVSHASTPAAALATRRAVTLLLLTLLAPGAAQLTSGNRRLGRIALSVWTGALATSVLAGLIWVISRGAAITVLTTPSVLALLGMLLVVGGVLWPALVVDAWRLGQDVATPLRARRWIAALAALVVVATSLPVMAAGRRVWAAGDLIGSVFGGGGEAAAADGRYNVLLLGGDAGANRIGLRPDSITLASIDADTGRTVLLSLPRNLENVPFPAGTPAAQALPEGWSCGDDCLLNALYQWGVQHRDLFPGARDAGAEAMKQAVQAVTGLKVNYYVLVDLKGFSELIDAVGGVELTVKRRVPIGGGTSPVHGYIEPGTRTLDGYHALWFARSRHGSSDYDRMARQRCVMDAMLAQLDPATLLRRFQKVASAGKQVVSTDIPAGQLGRFIDLGAKAKGQPVTSVQFVPPIITPARPDLHVIRSRVSAAIEAAEQRAAGDRRPTPSGGRRAEAGGEPRQDAGPRGGPEGAGAGGAGQRAEASPCGNA